MWSPCGLKYFLYVLKKMWVKQLLCHTQDGGSGGAGNRTRVTQRSDMRVYVCAKPFSP